jgi:excisionase family DNA binding protein
MSAGRLADEPCVKHQSEDVPAKWQGAATVQPLLHTVESAAKRLSIGRTLMFELIASGAVRSVRIKGRRLVPEAALVDFVSRTCLGPRAGDQ